MSCLEFFCWQIGKSFLHGHSTDNLEIVGATEQRTGPAEFVKLKLVASEVDDEVEDEGKDNDVTKD